MERKLFRSRRDVSGEKNHIKGISESGNTIRRTLRFTGQIVWETLGYFGEGIGHYGKGIGDFGMHSNAQDQEAKHRNNELQ